MTEAYVTNEWRSHLLYAPKKFYATCINININYINIFRNILQFANC